jgi:TolB-like protein/Tfp pilus assembly protein PilF
LRKALSDDAKEPRFIQTIPKGGYRLIAPTSLEGDKAKQNSVEEVASGETRIGARPRLWLNRRVLTFVLLLVVIAVAASCLLMWRKLTQSTTASPIKSIAVLPFKPLVTDSHDEALELGMADTVVLKLSNLKEIIVRPVVRKYTALDRDPLAAGREQSVDVVLDPSIQRSGERVRVSARLLRVSDGATLWTYKCEQHCADLFEMQDAIAEKVADSLTLRLTGEEKKALAKRYTDNTDAYRLYLLGRLYAGKGTEEGFRKGVEHFNQALQIDPNYALAYSGLSDAYNGAAQEGYLPPREGFLRCKELALKALEIDNTLAESHHSLGCVKFNFDWDWLGTEIEYKQGIEFDPSYMPGRRCYAEYLSGVGRHEEAFGQMKQALELDPTSVDNNVTLGTVFYLARQYDQAIEQLEKILDMDSGNASAHQLLGLAYEQKGKYREAITEIQRAVTLSERHSKVIASLGQVYAESGNRGKAVGLIEELKGRSKQHHVPPLFIRSHLYRTRRERLGNQMARKGIRR